MERKNTLLLTIIAVATLLVSVAGATFAYFTSSANQLQNLNVSATVNPLTSQFVTTSTDISMSISAADMMKDQANATDAKGNVTKSLKVEYTGTTGNNMKCTYNLNYKWNTGTGAYTKTTDATKEFTYQVANATTVAETNFVNSSTTAAQTLKTGEVITSTNGAKATKTYDITARFYNLNLDQNALLAGGAATTWSLTFYVDNVACTKSV